MEKLDITDGDDFSGVVLSPAWLLHHVNAPADTSLLVGESLAKEIL